MEPRFNEPLYNEVLGVRNDIPRHSNSKYINYMEKKLDITKPHYSEHIFSPLALRYMELAL